MERCVVAVCCLKCERVPPQAAGRKLDMTSWQLAFGRYMLAAHATGQFSVQDGMRYRDVVMELAMTAGTSGRGPLLGAFYDDAAR